MWSHFSSETDANLKGSEGLCTRVFVYKNENPTCILINPDYPAYGEATWDLKYVNASSDLILCFTRLPRNVGQMRITKQVFTFFLFLSNQLMRWVQCIKYQIEFSFLWRLRSENQCQRSLRYLIHNQGRIRELKA